MRRAVCFLVLGLVLATGLRSSATPGGAAEPRLLPLAPGVRGAAKTVPVLMYHRVSPRVHDPLDVTVDQLEAQLRGCRAAGATSLSLTEWATYQASPELLPDTPVIFTFDDATSGQYHYAAPLLEQYGFRGTFFIYTAIIGRGRGYMTWAEAADLARRGHELGAHSVSHGRLLARGRPGGAADERLQHEITACRETIGEKTGAMVTSFAYPYGVCDDRVVELVRAAGYLTAVLATGRANPAVVTDPHRIRRIKVCSQLSLARFFEAIAPVNFELVALATPHR